MAEYTLEGLAQAARIQTGTIRSYVAKGLLPRAVLRGPRTTYDDGYFVRLLAVRYLLHTERLSVRQIRAKLTRMNDAEVSAMLPRVAPPPPKVEAANAIPAAVGEKWERAVLLPGLELHLAAAASEAVRKVAADVAAQFRSRLAES
jgi:DNA-binding transcriptional MerR regulator